MSANEPASGEAPAHQPERIKQRILVPLVVAIGLLLTIFGLGLYEEQRRANERSIARAAQSVQRLLNDDQRRSSETMSMELQELLNDDRLADALQTRNAAFMNQRTDALFEDLRRVDKVTHFRFYSPEKTILLQKETVARPPDISNDSMLQAAERVGQIVSGLERSPQGTFVLMTVLPWRRDGQTLGYVELGVDLQDILTSIHQELQVELFVAVDKALLSRAPYDESANKAGRRVLRDQFPDTVVTDKTLETIPETAQTYLRSQKGTPEQRDMVVTRNGVVTQIMLLPVNDAEGRTQGQLIVLRDISQAIAETNQWKLAIALICLSVSLALTVFFYSYLGHIEGKLAEGTVKLREANEQLEARVEQRTSQLRTANEALLQEIAEREQAQQALVAAQKQLVAASRQAGMAEVATSVLHNVGNVLNSVNVSASLVSDRVEASRIGHIARIASMLNENAADLNHFMEHNPKGRPCLHYLNELGRHLADEQVFLLKELASVRENVEHINQIVAMQQSNAKQIGVKEKASLTDLVEDALRMTNGSLSAHQIQVTREFEPGLPEMILDRHKVFQILANLIHNARQACDTSGRTDKHLIIRVERAKNHVNILVADNGVGIPPENLTRIFNHGFTTRKDGHGFGLHSGALAAKEMGGQLTVQSEGPGKGAAFTLQLPCG